LCTLNRCLDEAIARAVTEYAILREREITSQETVHMGKLAQEMRDRLSAMMLSYDLLRQGRVGVTGNTGASLGRGLSGLRSVVDVAFARIRLESGTRNPERVSVSDFLEQAAADASVDANIRGVRLRVAAAELGAEVFADRPLLEAAFSKLIQNAITFSRTAGTVALRSRVAGDRVLVEIHDECGGLPAGTAALLSRSFGQPNAKRTESGLGLSIARECIEAIGGVGSVRDVPGIGCVFAIDLLRLPAALASPTPPAERMDDSQVA
jgi:signal transduction histidine kinase